MALAEPAGDVFSFERRSTASSWPSGERAHDDKCQLVEIDTSVDDSIRRGFHLNGKPPFGLGGLPLQFSH